jgi:two-component system nitrogen regulation response regulator GlnG
MSKCVLLVDDSKSVRRLTSLYIGQLLTGVKVYDFSSGEEALEKIKDISEEIIFCLFDYNMEGINGVELAEKIVDRVPSKNIALASANIQEAVQKKAEAQGMVFISKPVDKEKIKNFMDRIQK